MMNLIIRFTFKKLYTVAKTKTIKLCENINVNVMQTRSTMSNALKE